MNNVEHYNRVYGPVRAQGFHEPISLTANWQRRADALYAQINALSPHPKSGAAFWPGGIGLLADGRMACLAETYDYEKNETVVLFGVTE